MSTRLDTARLRLRDLETSDLDFVAEMLSHPEVMRHYPRPLGHDEALAWIERQRRMWDERFDELERIVGEQRRKEQIDERTEQP